MINCITVNAKLHSMIIAAIIKNKQNIIYGVSLALLLLLLKWLEWHFVIIDHAFEIYAIQRHSCFFYRTGRMACFKAYETESKYDSD